jgi:invasion protein IalB
MRTAPIAALAVLVLGVTAAPVLAQRSATAKETRSLARAIHGTPRCFDGAISTVNADWAKLTAVVNDDEACLSANGVAVFHRGTAGHWRAVLQAGADPKARCVDSKGRVPNAIIRDLNVCKIS